MLKKLIIWLFIPMICLQVAYAEENLPPPFKASFKLMRGFTLPAKVSFSLISLDNNQFIYRAEVLLSKWAATFYKFHLLQESRWQVHNQQIQPLEYNYKKISRKSEKHKKVLFDWDNNQAYATENGKEMIISLKDNIGDELTYHINMLYDLKTGRDQTSYTFISGLKTKTYHLEKTGNELIKTPFGKFNAIKIQRQSKNRRSTTTLWFAEELHYIPIKFVHIDKNNKSTTGVLNSLEWLE